MENIKNTFAPRLAAFIFALAVLAGCNAVTSLQKLSITSSKLESVIPEGLRNARVGLRLGIDNPSSQIDLKDLTAAIYRSDEPVMTLSSEGLSIEKESSRDYRVDISFQLSDQLNVLELAEMLSNLYTSGYDLSPFTLDLAGKVGVNGGAPQNINLKKLPLENIIRLGNK